MRHALNILCQYTLSRCHRPYVSRTGERKAVRETAFASEIVQLAAHFKLSQNYYLTVFSGLFSEFFVKRDTIQSNIQFSTEPARTVTARGCGGVNPAFFVCITCGARSLMSNLRCT